MSYMKLNFGYGGLLLNISDKSEEVVGVAQTPQCGPDMLILLIENLE